MEYCLIRETILLFEVLRAKNKGHGALKHGQPTTHQWMNGNRPQKTHTMKFISNVHTIGYPKPSISQYDNDTDISYGILGSA